MVAHVPKVGGEAIMAKVEFDLLLKAECTLKDISNRMQKSTCAHINLHLSYLFRTLGERYCYFKCTLINMNLEISIGHN